MTHGTMIRDGKGFVNQFSGEIVTWTRKKHGMESTRRLK